MFAQKFKGGKQRFCFLAGLVVQMLASISGASVLASGALLLVQLSADVLGKAVCVQ